MGTKIISKTTILKILVILTVEAILSIYISDMLGCIFEEYPILALELITFSAVLSGTISVTVVLKKKEIQRLIHCRKNRLRETETG
jgi:hypothetical protein